MKKRRYVLLWLLVGMIVIVGLPLAGKWARRRAEPRCELDGLRVEPLYRVRIVDGAGQSHAFCCVHCAAQWLARHGDQVAEVRVTDEVGGEEIDARAAWFVESRVVTQPVVGNRVHVFQSREAAEEHVRAFGGHVLQDTERPFQPELTYRKTVAAPGLE